jgi:16S rRNA (cytidine1402-2'-O)-methyltransferase
LVEALPGAEGLGGGLAALSNEKISARIARMQAEVSADRPLDENQALKRLARELGQSKSDLYRELQRERARRR